VNLPNALTLSRIFVVPLLVVVLLTPLAEDYFGVGRHILGLGLFIAASKLGKFKMFTQVIAIALLIVSSVKGAPPVANFGQIFPAFNVWTIPELQTAVRHFFGTGVTTLTDYQVLLYTSGRAMLWVVVVAACVSMVEYFRAFYQVVAGRPLLVSAAGDTIKRSEPTIVARPSEGEVRS